MSHHLQEGLHQNVPMSVYVDDPAPVASLSKGTIHRLITQSPAHARHHHPRLNPNCPRDDSSRADIGTAVHSVILGGGEIVFAPEEFQDWRKKDARAWRDQAREEGKVPLLDKQRAVIEPAAQAALGFLSRHGFDALNAETEGTMIWKSNGSWKRGRFDLWYPAKRMIIDVKTCENANPWAWARTSMIGSGYDIQAEHYIEGIKAVATEGRDVDMLFLLVEIAPPYGCTFVGLGEAYSAMARKKIELAEGLWKECLDADKWPSFDPGPTWVEPPPWAMAEVEEKVAIKEMK